MSDKCPKCGSKLHYCCIASGRKTWKCGTSENSDGSGRSRSDKCRIAELESENRRLRDECNREIYSDADLLEQNLERAKQVDEQSARIAELERQLADMTNSRDTARELLGILGTPDERIKRANDNAIEFLRRARDSEKQLAEVTAERDEARRRLLSAAGDDLCRLTPDEIKDLTSGKVQIPPKAEFIASCERFHSQIAGDAGVLGNCLTLAQLIAENESLRAERDKLKANAERIVSIAEEIKTYYRHTYSSDAPEMEVYQLAESLIDAVQSEEEN